MANSKTQILQEKTIKELTKEAKKAKEDLENYLEDLELYTNPKFWEAVREAEIGKVTKYKNVKEYAKKMGLE